MSLSVKFGQHLIFKENLQNISEDIKKNEWTENKIYKSANFVEIKPTFDTSPNNQLNQVDTLQSLMMKLKSNKEVLEKMSNQFFSKQISKEQMENFSEYKKDLVDVYYNDKFINKKKNLLNFSKTISYFTDVDKSDIESINNTDLEEIAKFKNSKLLDYIKKYKFSFLLAKDYKNLSQDEKNNLIKFLQNEEKKKSGIQDINDFYIDFTNSNKVIIKDSNVNDNHPLNNFSIFGSFQNEEQRRKDSDLLVSRKVMFNDFRLNVKDNYISDEMIMKYLNQTQNLEKAAGLYFRDLYGSNKLKVCYMLPNNSQNLKEFDLIQSPEDLFMFVYSIFPEVIDPKLFLNDGTQIIIDPLKDKFIGGLKIPQNSLIFVKF